MAYSNLVETDKPPKKDFPPSGGGIRVTYQTQPALSAVPQGLADQPRRLSLPFSEQRRQSSYGIYNRTVVVAVDASDHSRDAFNWYLSNVWRSDDLLIVVHCPEAPNFPTFSLKQGFRLPTDKWTEIVSDMNTKAQKLENDYEGMFVARKLRYKIRGESCKNPGEAVCRIADEEKADLIVMGSRGMGTVKRVLIGSVSEYIVRNANTPCLVIPALK
jgi:nucleotide-binding universal stress UspA family protein